MAANGTVIIDIIEGARLREQRGIVQEITRLAIVEGIVLQNVPGGGIGQHKVNARVIDEALNHDDMPQPGDPHPLTGALIVKDRVANAVSTRIIQVEIVYRPRVIDEQLPPEGFASQIGGETNLEQIDTQVDRSGGQITVMHDDIVQGGSVSVLMPRDVARFTTLEQSLVPGSIARAYVGKTNSELWNGGVAGQWLCTGISFDLTERTLSPPGWTYTYLFRFDPDGHDPQVVFIDPESGKPPPGLIPGEGFKTIPWYFTANFHDLSLI